MLSTSTQKPCAVQESAQLRFVAIKSIKHLGKQDVYNLTVDKHHNYLVNEGIISKNCDTDRYALMSSDVRNTAGTTAVIRGNGYAYR